MGENQDRQGEMDGEACRERRQSLVPPVKGRTPAGIAPEGIIPNPKLKLMEQIPEVIRLKHYSIPNGAILLGLDSAVYPFSSNAVKS